MDIIQVLSISVGIALFFLLLKKWSECELSLLEMSAAAFINALLIFCALTVPQKISRHIASGHLCSGFALLAWGSHVQGLIILKQMILEEYNTALEAAEVDPLNAGSRIALAKSLYKMGKLEQAIRQLKAAVELGGVSCLGIDRGLLDEWETELDEQKRSGIIICRHCKTENPKHSKVCRKCERWLHLTDKIADWLLKSGFRIIIKFWAVSMAIIASLIIALSFNSLYAKIFAPIIAISVLLWALAFNKN